MLFWRCESMCGIAIKFRVFVFKKTELRQKSHLDSYFLLGGYLISFVFFNRYIMDNLAKKKWEKSEKVNWFKIKVCLPPKYRLCWKVHQYLKCLTQREKISHYLSTSVTTSKPYFIHILWILSQIMQIE